MAANAARRRPESLKLYVSLGSKTAEMAVRPQDCRRLPLRLVQSRPLRFSFAGPLLYWASSFWWALYGRLYLVLLAEESTSFMRCWLTSAQELQMSREEYTG